MITKKVALVLSGGGARGIAHIGAIEVLQEMGYTISAISGTSMGAMVGGFYSAGKLDEFKSWLLALDKMKIFKLMDFSFTSKGLIKGEKLIDALSKIIGDVKIEDLPIPYSASSVDLVKRQEVVHTSGNLLEAIRASIAIPTVLTPVEKNGSLLVDGGVMNNIPVGNIKRKMFHSLIVVNVNAAVPVIELETVAEEKSELKIKQHLDKLKNIQQFFVKEHPQDHTEKLGYLSLFDKTYSLMMHSMVSMAMEKHKPDITINISRDTCSTFDFLKAEELIEIGRIATRDYFDNK